MTRIAWLTALAAAIALPQAGAAQGEPEPYRVAVERKVRDSEDRWVARFTFPSDAPIWALQRLALTREGGSSWRIGNWHVVTKGVSLGRIGDFEALVGVVTMQEWLAAARAFGVSEERIAIMRDLLENGSAEGARALDSLLLQ